MPQEVKEEQTQEQTEKEPAAVSAQPAPVSFPVGMLLVAICFDFLGMIPFINIFSEILAGFILGFWQKMYAPKTDPVLSFFVSIIIDLVFLGLLPRNIAIVVFAYFKKRAAAKKPKLPALDLQKSQPQPA